MPLAKTHAQVLLDHSAPLANGCILWTGSRDKDGYGKCKRNHEEFGRINLPHRLAYVLAYGKIPDGCEIDHDCRNRSCVNPIHLLAMPHADNVKRSERARNRHRNGKKTHCKRGHSLSGANLVVEAWHGIVMRKCRSCRSENQRKRYQIKVRET